MKQVPRAVPSLAVAALLLIGGCASSAKPAAAASSVARAGVEGPPPAPKSGPLRDLAFIAGHWRGLTDEGHVSEEFWTPPAGGLMLGVNRTVAGNEAVFFEQFRIDVDPASGSITLHAAPMGRAPATPFRLVESSLGRAVFENPDHDFPQRISYFQAEGGPLRARIEGSEDGAPVSVEWSWWRVPPGG